MQNFMSIPRDKNTENLIHLYRVAATDWIPKLGRESFSIWLEIMSLTEREGSGTIGSISAALGMSEKTFQKHLQTLWNYGFLDFEEEINFTTKEKYLKVIVYSAPQNKMSLMGKPLKKVRDYENNKGGASNHE